MLNIFAGKAIFTLMNDDTGNHFTYKVEKSKDGKIFFVSVLIGGNNLVDYSYLGIIVNGGLRLTAKSKVTKEAKSYKAFSWLLNHQQSLPESVNVIPMGFCLRCGRPLTHPDSLKTGIGPECAKLIGG